MFTVSEKKALMSVLHLSNLFITEHFIGPADLVANMKTLQINFLHYNKTHNVYNILSLKYYDFTDIFQAAETQSLSVRGSHNHTINLKPGQQPLFEKLYSMSSAELDTLKVYLNNAVEAGIIQKSILSAASSVIFVLKSDSSLHLIIDYRCLNDITIKNCYPLPLISDMLDCLQGARRFTKLNCKNAYNCIHIKGGDEWKTVFYTQFSLFKYLVMSFKLINASATFQAFIDKALSEFLNIACIIYLNNILIFSKEKSKHEEHV